MRQTIITYAAVLLAVLALPSEAGLFGLDRKNGPKEVDVSYTFRMRHYAALGSGCAVNGMTLTNRHMVDPRAADDFDPLHKIRFRYEFLDGVTQGRGYTLRVSNHADLAEVKLDKDPPFGYARLGARPIPDMEVFWMEYDWRKQEAIYAQRPRKSTIIRTTMGIAILKDPPSNGASGGCAYNANGDVIGLMTFYVDTEDHKTSGGVVGLWGQWWADVGGPK